jgi:hypothetical protein
MKKVTIIALVCLINFTAVGQSQEDYSQVLKQMFELSGAEKTYQAAIIQMTDTYKKNHPDLDPDFVKEMEQEFLKTSIDDLTEMLTPIYQKYMTIEDLKAMIAFYETPSGQKFAEFTPMITQESMRVGQEWGMKIGQEMARRMAEESN